VIPVHTAQERKHEKFRRVVSTFRAHTAATLVAAVALVLSATMSAQSAPMTELKPGTLVGTVTDANQDTVRDATVTLGITGSTDRRTVVTNDNGYFEFHDLKPGTAYQVSVTAAGFADWQSSDLILEPGQFKILAGIKLRIQTELTTVQVTYDPVEVATEQVRVQEQQRVLGFIPNFYVAYDPDPAPLTTKLKFQLALKVAQDPVTIAGVAFLAGMQQAGDRPDYGQGMRGYGKRFGATATGDFTNIMLGGAILPSLLHQDPRYFYKGTGSTASRIRYAMMHPFVCKGDNGKWQPNYSSLGGDLGSAALSNVYYPKADRGASLILSSFLIDTGARAVASLAQEFLLRKFTHGPDNTK
jgi:hypothetical protein